MVGWEVGVGVGVGADNDLVAGDAADNGFVIGDAVSNDGFVTGDVAGNDGFGEAAANGFAAPSFPALNPPGVVPSPVVVIVTAPVPAGFVALLVWLFVVIVAEIDFPVVADIGVVVAIPFPPDPGRANWGDEICM